MAKRRGGNLPRVMPSQKRTGLDIRIAMPGLPIVAPDPLAVSLGGSETAGLQLAAELVRQGHRVTIACNTPEPFTWRGVRLQGGFQAAELATPCDLFLVQRAPEILRNRGGARAGFLWLHDLLAPELAGPLTALAPLADRIVTVSRWQTEQYRAAAPGLAEDRFLVARNGIDLELIAEATAGVERDPFRIVYTSRPERGLEVLTRGVLPLILQQEPRASLHLASYDFPGSGVEDYQRFLCRCGEPFGDRIVWHEPLSKRGLYRLLAGSGLALYPTPAPIAPGFAETSCITAMEAMACGLPWISTDRGALPETVGDAGVLVPMGDAAHAGEPVVAERLAEEAVRVMSERDHADRLRAAGLERAQSLGWAPVAEQIVAETMAVIEAKARRRSSLPALKQVRAPDRPTARVMVATPVYGEMVHMGFCDSLLRSQEALRNQGVEMSWIARSGSSARRGRNELVADFLAQPAMTHLMWIDADISWPADAIGKLVAHDLPVAVGLYCGKAYPTQWFFIPPGGRDRVPRRKDGLFGVEGVAGGFVLVKREVYLEMIEAYPERHLHGEDREPAAFRPWYFDLHPEEIVDGVVQSEDYGFGRLWRQLGGEIWVDPSIQLGHHGMHEFTADPMTAFIPAPQVDEAA